MDKNQLRQLNQGAELTSSSDEDENMTAAEIRAKRDKVSSSMQRSIDRLLKSTL